MNCWKSITHYTKVRSNTAKTYTVASTAGNKLQTEDIYCTEDERKQSNSNQPAKNPYRYLQKIWVQLLFSKFL